jgi:ActR/RegA family two-component response regulator
MFYSPGKLVLSYGVPATTPAFVYHALGRKPLPTKDRIVEDTVSSIASQFNLRYNDQKWVAATAALIADDADARRRFLRGDMSIFDAAQFVRLGGIQALAAFGERDAVFEALRQSTMVRQTTLTENAA